MKQLKWTNLLLVCAIYFFACKKNDLHQSNAKATSPNLYTVTLNGQDVQVLKKGDLYYFYDDVMFDQETFDSLQLLTKSTKPRSAVSTALTNYWPNSIVYYTLAVAFDNYPNEKQRIIDAINHWQANTPLQFIQRTNQSNYIGFERVLNQDYAGAANSIGMKGGYQYIRLDAADPFDRKTVIHEIGHAIGLYHEQSRADRDNFIVVYPSNSSDSYQLQTYNQQGRPGVDVGTFDWNSIMLYDSYAGSSNGSATMLRKSDLQPFYTYFNTSLSLGDVEGIRSIYEKLYYKLRYVSITGSRYSAPYQGNVYIDFFTDATLTTPKILDYTKILHIRKEGIDVYNCSLSNLSGIEGILLSSGQSSYYIGEEHHHLECASAPEDDYLYYELP